MDKVKKKKEWWKYKSGRNEQWKEKKRERKERN